MKKIIDLTVLTLFLLVASAPLFAQTSAFSYQGRLSEAGAPVTGTRYFHFVLYDENNAPIAGVDQTLAVTSGVLNTSLDFGPAAFPGPGRSLEISVKVNPGDPFTTLAPRQPILSAPYSIKSTTATTASNATQLGGLPSTRYVQQDPSGNVSIAGNLTVT